MTDSHPEAEHSFDDAYKDAPYMYGHPYQELQDFFKNQTKRGTVLDLGSGQGRDALFLAKLGYDVTAVDSSRVGVEQMLKKAQEDELQVEGIVADVLDVEIVGKYDVILFDMILHAFEESKQLELLKKYSKNLKPTGMICIVFPDDMPTDHFTNKLNSLPHKWELEDEISIRDVPKLDDQKLDYTFVMICGRLLFANNV